MIASSIEKYNCSYKHHAGFHQLRHCHLIVMLDEMPESIPANCYEPPRERTDVLEIISPFRWGRSDVSCFTNSIFEVIFYWTVVKMLNCFHDFIIIPILRIVYYYYLKYEIQSAITWKHNIYTFVQYVYEIHFYCEKQIVNILYYVKIYNLKIQ